MLTIASHKFTGFPFKVVLGVSGNGQIAFHPSLSPVTTW
jgi:hypothetical protein